jgi:hypothetical protein
VTTGSINDLTPGALGQPGTRVLFGGNTVLGDAHSGVRGTAGIWLNEDHTLGVELGGFFLFPKRSNFSDSSFGSPLLFRPFTDAATGAQTVEVVAAPGVLAGTVSVHNLSSLWGAEVNLRSNIFCNCNLYVDGLLGFRYLGLDESLSVGENLTDLMTPGTINLNDRFGTHNRFWGTQVGAYGEYRMGPWSFGLKAAVALGPAQQIVDISGNTVITTPTNGRQNFPGGLLAQSTNIGRHTRDVFGVVPEGTLTAAYQVTNHMRVFVGYNYLYWNSVVRPGNAIDRTVNTNLLAPPIGGGPNRPAFAFRGSDFWAQGATVGVEFRY